jgi:hypothetical protein
MPEVSCFFIDYSTIYPHQIIFVKFDNYFMISLNPYPCNSVILSKATMMSIPHLFEMYILSLLATRDTQSLKLKKPLMRTTTIRKKYIIETKFFYRIIGDYKNYSYEKVSVGHKNLLNKNEPKRESSNKKISKFVKHFNLEINKNDPISMMKILIQHQTQDIKEMIIVEQHRNDVIRLLTGIRKKFGQDVYDMVRKYLS